MQSSLDTRSDSWGQFLKSVAVFQSIVQYSQDHSLLLSCTTVYCTSLSEHIMWYEYNVSFHVWEMGEKYALKVYWVYWIHWEITTTLYPGVFFLWAHHCIAWNLDQLLFTLHRNNTILILLSCKCLDETRHTAKW